jgi:MFS superfamily sulfate permease-like transporter
MQLAVGPVAIVSLLVGSLVNKYVENPSVNTEAAIDTAAQASLCCGIILSAMALLNMGDFINFLAHPVMSGFTSGAACTIGLNQMKSAFGMSVQVPQAGQPHYEFNYQVMDWWSRHFNNQFEFNPVTAKNAAQNGRWLRNHYAVKVHHITVLNL